MDSSALIRQFLEQRLGVAPECVVPEASLDALGVDSLMFLELVFEFEDHFGVTLSRNLKPPKTIGEMAALMDRQRGTQQA